MIIWLGLERVHANNLCIQPGRVFDRVIGMDEVPDGYRVMDKREAIKVMVEP